MRSRTRIVCSYSSSLRSPCSLLCGMITVHHQPFRQFTASSSVSQSIVEAGLEVASRRVMMDISAARATLPSTRMTTVSGARESSPLPSSLLTKLASIQVAIQAAETHLNHCRQRRCSPGSLSFGRSSLVGLGNPICNAVIYGMHTLGHQNASFEVYRAVLELRRTRRDLWVQFNVSTDQNTAPSSSSRGSPSDQVDLQGINELYGGNLLTFVGSAEEAEACCRNIVLNDDVGGGGDRRSEGPIAVLSGVSLAQLVSFATPPSPLTHISRRDPPLLLITKNKVKALQQLQNKVLLPRTFQESLQRLLLDFNDVLRDHTASTHAAGFNEDTRTDGCTDTLPLRLWATGGTALGAVRHGQSIASSNTQSKGPNTTVSVTQFPPIPWDDDIDFCMLDSDESRLQAALNFPVGLPSRDLFLEFCPLFGYKLYALPPSTTGGGNEMALSSSDEAFGQYGCFIDVFLMSTTTPSPPLTGTYRQGCRIYPSFSFAREAWPKEVFTLSQVKAPCGSLSHVSVVPSVSSRITPLALNSTTASISLINRHHQQHQQHTNQEGTKLNVIVGPHVLDCFGVIEDTYEYLQRTFGQSSLGGVENGGGGEVSSTPPPTPPWVYCGVVPQSQHGRNFSHPLYIPITRNESITTEHI